MNEADKNETSSNVKKIMLGMWLAVGAMALYICLISTPASAFGAAGFGSALNAAATTAVAGAGVHAATTATDDDDDDN